LAQKNPGPIGMRTDGVGVCPSRGTGCGVQRPLVGARRWSHEMIVI